MLTTNKLKSTVTSYARIKPKNEPSSQNKSSTEAFTINQSTSSLTINTSPSITYQFNKVFNPQSTQEEIFDVIGTSILTDIIKGTNTSLLCMGGANSGKTFSLFGPMYTLHEEETKLHGVLPRFLSFIFDENKLKETFKFGKITMEISYCGVMIDNNDNIQNLIGKELDSFTYIKLENYEKAKYIINSYIKNIDQDKTFNESSILFLFKVSSIYSYKGEEDKIQSYESNIIFGDLAQQSSGSIISLENAVNYYVNNKALLNTQSKLVEVLKEIIGGDSKCNIIYHFSQNILDMNDTLNMGKFNNDMNKIESYVSQHENSTIMLQKILKEKETLEEQLKNKKSVIPIDENIIKCIKEIYSNEIIKDFIHKKMKFDLFVNKINNKTKNLLTNNKNSIIDNYVIERFMAEMPNIKVASKLNKEIIESLSKLANSEFVYKLTNILSNSNINENTTDKKTFEDIIKSEKELLLENEQLLISQLNNEKSKNFILQCELAQIKKEQKVIIESENKEILDKVVLSLIEMKKEIDEKYSKITEQNNEINKLKETILNFELKEKKYQEEISNLKRHNDSLKSSEDILKAQYKNSDNISKFFQDFSFDDIYKSIEKVNSDCDIINQIYQSDLETVRVFYIHVSDQYKKYKEKQDKERPSGTSDSINALPKYIFARAFVGEELRRTKNKKEKIEKEYKDLDRENIQLKEDIIQYKETIENLKKNQNNSAEANQLKEEIKKLKQNIEDIEKEKQELFNEKNNYFKQVNEVKAQNNKIIKEKNEQISKIEKELFDVNNRKVTLEKKMIEMEESKQYLTSKLENAYIQKMRFQSEKEKLNKELSESNDKLNEYQEKMNTLLKEKEDIMNQKEFEIQKLIEEKNEIAKQKEENELKQAQITQFLSQAKKNYEKNREETEKEIERLNTEKSYLEKEATSLKQKENELSSQVSTLKDDIEKIKEEKKRIESEKYKYIEENVQLSKQMSEIIAQLKKIQEEKEQAEMNYKGTTEKLRIAEEQIKKLLVEKEKEINEISNHMNAIKKEKEAIDKEKKEAEKQCTALHNKLNDLLSQLLLLEKEKKTIDHNNHTKIGDISSQISNINNLINSLKGELNEKEKNKQDLEKKYKELTDENESLIKDKERLMEELEKMKQKSKENEERLNKKINDYQLKTNDLNEEIEQLSKDKEEISNNQKEIENKAKDLNNQLEKLNNQKNQIDIEKIYLQKMVSELIEDVYSFKDNDIIGLRNQNKKYQEKFKEIFGKKYDINTTDYKRVNWNKSTLTILNQKIILLREEKKQLNQDLALIRSYIKGSISESLKNSQFCLLVQIKEQNRRLKKELEIIKIKNKKLQSQIADSYQVEEKDETSKYVSRNRTKLNTIKTKSINKTTHSSVGKNLDSSSNKKSGYHTKKNSIALSPNKKINN